jgi:t-SNARE complex subunit (syntaxin)
LEQAHAQAREVEEKKKQNEERLLRAYETYQQEELANIRRSLSPGKLEAIEREVQEELEAEHPGSKIFAAWLRRRTDRVLAEKYSLLPFHEWQKRCG